MAKIIVTGNDQRREFELGAINTIGRHPDNTLQILDRIVSKEHAQVVRQPDGRFLFRDLGSLNGSFLRGERVNEHILHENDEIMLGSTCLTFQEQSAPESLLQKVTIAPSAGDALIRQKIQAPPAVARVPAREGDLRRRGAAPRLREAPARERAGRSIGLEVNLELLLEQIIMKAFELLPADRGVILLMEDGVPSPKIAKTRDGKNEQIVLSKSILNEVVTNKASVLSSDATMDSRFSAAHSVIMQGIRSTMTVPLIHHDELLGIMHLDSMIATNAFTEKDLQIFGGIGSQAAVAIHNSQLARKIEHEAKTRAQFQRLLSPNLVDQVVQGKLQLEKGGALSEVTLLFSDIRGFTSMSESRAPARDRPHAQRILRADGGRDLQVRRDAGQVRRRRGHRAVRRARADAERRGQGGAVRAGHDARAVGVQPHARRRRPARDQRRHRHQHRAWSSRARSAARARCSTRPSATRSTRRRACAAPRRRARSSCPRPRSARCRATSPPCRCRPIRVKGKAEELRVYNAVGMRSRQWSSDTTRPTGGY